MKAVALLLFSSLTAFSADDLPNILSEDAFSPYKLDAPFDGKNIEFRTFSYDNDRVRIIAKKVLSGNAENRNLYSIIIDGENECYTAEIKSGEIIGNGDKDIQCKKIKDNTKYYPFIYPAYLIYSKKYNFVFPIVDYKNCGHFFDSYDNGMIEYFSRKYLK